MNHHRLAATALLAIIAGCQSDVTQPTTRMLAPTGAPSAIILPGSGQWAEHAAPLSRRWSSGAWVGGQFYLVGGVDPATGGPTNTVQRYDPVANTWSTVAPTPTPIAHHQVVGLGGYLYAMGGVSSGDAAVGTELWRYSPTANVWSSVASMPEGRVDFAAAAMGGHICIAGGSTGPGAVSTNAYCYWAAYDFWYSIASFDGAAPHQTGTGAPGIFVVGGGNSNVLWLYDIAHDSWHMSSPGNDQRIAPALGIIDSVVYVLAGAQHGGGPAAYDPHTDMWTELNPALTGSAQHSFSYDVYKNTLWVMGTGSTLNDALNVSFKPASRGNHPPVVSLESALTGTEGTPMYFLAGGSTDPDGDPMTATWDFGDGTTTDNHTLQATHTYTAPGHYTLTLSVSDGQATTTVHRTLTVKNSPPRLEVAPVADTIFHGETAHIDVWFSAYNPGPYATTVAWDGGAAQSVSNANDHFAGEAQLSDGGHVATFSVTDSRAGVGNGRATVRVLTAGQAARWAAAHIALVPVTSDSLLADRTKMVNTLKRAGAKLDLGDQAGAAQAYGDFSAEIKAALGHGLPVQAAQELYNLRQRLMWAAGLPTT